MVYPIDRIVHDVRVHIDENRVDARLISEPDPDTLMLEEAIRAHIIEGVQLVHRNAPYHLLEQGHTFQSDSDAIYWRDLESGFLLLPDDFMRLVVFEMSDWERPVYSVITPADKEYKRQHSRVKALRGTAQRPVCALVVRNEGKALEFYSCKSQNATIVKAVYIPYPIIENNSVDISEHCHDAAVYAIAALTLQAYGENDKSKALFDTIKTMLE